MSFIFGKYRCLTKCLLLKLNHSHSKVNTHHTHTHAYWSHSPFKCNSISMHYVACTVHIKKKRNKYSDNKIETVTFKRTHTHTHTHSYINTALRRQDLPWNLIISIQFFLQFLCFHIFYQPRLLSRGKVPIEITTRLRLCATSNPQNHRQNLLQLVSHVLIFLFFFFSKKNRKKEKPNNETQHNEQSKFAIATQTTTILNMNRFFLQK